MLIPSSVDVKFIYYRDANIFFKRTVMFRSHSTTVDKCSQHFIGTELSTYWDDFGAVGES